MVLCFMLQAGAGKHDKYLNNRGLRVCTANRKCQTFAQIQTVVFSAGGMARSYFGFSTFKIFSIIFYMTPQMFAVSAKSKASARA